MEKKLKETMDKIEKRKPILDVLEAEGVKAAYNESQKRKREEEEESKMTKSGQGNKINTLSQKPGFKRMTIFTT